MASSILNKLKGQFPSRNEELAKSQKAARDHQLQQAVRSAPQKFGAAGQIAAAGAQQAGQETAGRITGATQTGSQIGGLGIQEEQRGIQEKLAGKELDIGEQRITGAEKLSEMDESAKDEILNNRLDFQKDRAGDIFFNDRQMADFMVLQAKDQEELKQWQQKEEFYSKRKMQVLQHQSKVLTQAMEQSQRLGDDRKAKEQQLAITRWKQEVENKMAKEAARSKNKAMMTKAVVTVAVGAAVIASGGAAAVVLPSMLAAGAGADMYTSSQGSSGTSTPGYSGYEKGEGNY